MDCSSSVIVSASPDSAGMIQNKFHLPSCFHFCITPSDQKMQNMLSDVFYTCMNKIS